MAELPPLFVKLGAQIGEFQAAFGTAEKELASFNRSHETSAAGWQSSAMKIQAASRVVGAGMLAVGAYSVKQASDFQSSQERLVTTAGESRKNLDMVSQGILQMAGQVGYSAADLSKGMYTVESAGIHGADALTVLKAAAEGAKEENANLGDVTNAVTTVLTDFRGTAGSAAQVTSGLIRAVSLGKTSFQDLTGALHSVLPVAQSAHLSWTEMAADLSQLTIHGMGAEQASQNMAHAIRSLMSPTQQQTKAMAEFGIQSHDVSSKLSSRGLAGTIQYLSQSILSQMGPAGEKLKTVMNQSTLAGQDAKKMFDALPPAAKALAQEYEAGGTSVGGYRKSVKDLTGAQYAQITAWKSQYDASQNFAAILKTGGDSSKTYTSALGKMMGTTDGLNVALMLSGQNTKYVNAAIKAVGESAKGSKTDVEGFSDTQHTLKFQMDAAKEALNAMAITLGTTLLPIITPIIAKFNDWLQILGRHPEALKAVVAAIGSFAAVGSVLMPIINTFFKMQETIGKVSTAVRDAGGAVKVFQAGLGMITSPIGIAVIALAALGVAIYEIVKHWQTIKRVGIEAWDSMKSAASNGSKAVSSAMSSAWSTVERVTSDAWNSVKKSVTSAATSIAAPVGSAWDSVKRSTSSAWESVKTTVEAGGKTTAAALNGAWQQVKSFTSQAWDGVKSVTSQAWDAISGFFKKWWPLLLVIFAPGVALIVGVWNRMHTQIIATTKAEWDTVLAVFRGVWQQISSVFTSALHGIESALSSAWQVMSAAAKAAWAVLAAYFRGVWSEVEAVFTSALHTLESTLSQAWATVSAATKAAWAVIVAYLRGVWDQIRSVVVSAASTVRGALSSAWQSVQSVTQSAWSGISTVVSQALQQLVQSAQRAAQPFVQGIQSMLQQARYALSNVGQWFVSVGQNIVQGLVQGVEQSGSSLMSALSNMANSALSAAKSALGIHSPSRVMAEEVGVWIPRGIAVGIAAEGKSATEAVQQVVDKVTSTASKAATTVKTGTSGTTRTKAEAEALKLAEETALKAKKQAQLDAEKEQLAVLKGLATQIEAEKKKASSAATNQRHAGVEVHKEITKLTEELKKNPHSKALKEQLSRLESTYKTTQAVRQRDLLTEAKIDRLLAKNRAEQAAVRAREKATRAIKTTVAMPSYTTSSGTTVSSGSSSSSSGSTTTTTTTTQTLEIKMPLTLTLDGKKIAEGIQPIALQYQMRNGKPMFSLK